MKVHRNQLYWSFRIVISSFYEGKKLYGQNFTMVMESVMEIFIFIILRFATGQEYFISLFAEAFWE